MLEVIHLTKLYKTKGGADVRALDDVSLRFPEKGMVFLLGRSGSGKSTLLNVCGGLDSPTSGEIVVKGRSSRDFTQSDFDSYRNTFVGFVFQEYNIRADRNSASRSRGRSSKIPKSSWRTSRQAHSIPLRGNRCSIL